MLNMVVHTISKSHTCLTCLTSTRATILLLVSGNLCVFDTRLGYIIPNLMTDQHLSPAKVPFCGDAPLWYSCNRWNLPKLENVMFGFHVFLARRSFMITWIEAVRSPRQADGLVIATSNNYTPRFVSENGVYLSIDPSTHPSSIYLSIYLSSHLHPSSYPLDPYKSTLKPYKSI